MLLQLHHCFLNSLLFCIDSLSVLFSNFLLQKVFANRVRIKWSDLCLSRNDANKDQTITKELMSSSCSSPAVSSSVITALTLFTEVCIENIKEIIVNVTFKKIYINCTFSFTKSTKGSREKSHDRKDTNKNVKKRKTKCIKAVSLFNSGAWFTDQSLLQGHDGAFQPALHVQDVLWHWGHMELKPG